MTAPRATVCLSFDFDAISLWIGPMGATSPSMISRGEFGAVGVERILRLLAREGIRATFFVTGHTAETYPDHLRAIVAAGHEVGHHGYLHENPVGLTLDEERRVLDMALDGTTRAIQPVLTPAEIYGMQEVVRLIYIDDQVKEYILNVVRATRDPAAFPRLRSRPRRRRPRPPSCPGCAPRRIPPHPRRAPRPSRSWWRS
jgi:hypothetical protein